MLKFYTNWVLFLNNFYFLLGVLLQHFGDHASFEHVYLVMCELTLIGNVIICAVYWPLLFDLHMQQFEGEPLR